MKGLEPGIDMTRLNRTVLAAVWRGQKASGMKPGDQIGVCCNHANRGDHSLDQVIGCGGDEMWLDFGFIWKTELVGFAEEEPQTITITTRKIITRS